MGICNEGSISMSPVAWIGIVAVWPREIRTFGIVKDASLSVSCWHSSPAGGAAKDVFYTFNFPLLKFPLNYSAYRIRIYTTSIHLPLFSFFVILIPILGRFLSRGSPYRTG